MQHFEIFISPLKSTMTLKLWLGVIRGDWK